MLNTSEIIVSPEEDKVKEWTRRLNLSTEEEGQLHCLAKKIAGMGVEQFPNLRWSTDVARMPQVSWSLETADPPDDRGLDIVVTLFVSIKINGISCASRYIIDLGYLQFTDKYLRKLVQEWAGFIARAVLDAISSTTLLGEIR